MNKKTELFLERAISFLFNVPIGGYYSYVERGTHKDMVTESCSIVKVSTFREFRTAFDQCPWRPISGYPGALMANDRQDYYHASIIRFNGTGCLLTSYGLFRARIYVKGYIRRNFQPVTKFIY